MQSVALLLPTFQFPDDKIMKMTVYLPFIQVLSNVVVFAYSISFSFERDTHTELWKKLREHDKMFSFISQLMGLLLSL